MAPEVDLLRRAAAKVRACAQDADTGEDWELTKHYDDLYCVDFKPSVPDADTVEDHRHLPDDPDEPGMPRPADIYAHFFQARHITLWSPRVAPIVADLLDSEASLHEDDPSFERDTEPLCDVWPFVRALARELLKEDA